MPLQQNTQVEGRIGDLIFYKSKGQYLIRKKGGTGRQAEAARRQSGIMGKASALSAAIRKGVRPILPAETEPRQLMYRLNNVLQQWLRSQPDTTHPDQVAALVQFSSSSDSPFYISMKIERTESRGLLVKIPAFESRNPIEPLPFYGVIDLKFVAVSCPLDSPGKARVVPVDLHIPYTGIGIAAQDLPIPIQTETGHLTVLWLTVNGMSSGVVGAYYN